MTGPSSPRPSGRAASLEAAVARPGPGDRLAKRVSGLRLACLAATFMILAQDGLGFGIAQALSVPSADKGSGIFAAIGRALSGGPIAISVHAGLGLLLIVTGISVIIRAVLASRNAVLAISAAGLAGILAANAFGARFVGTGNDTDSAVMAATSLAALACYLACLILLRTRRPAAR